MFQKRTRVLCYGVTLLPALLRPLIWKDANIWVLLTPVLMELALALCFYMSDKLETDREKNKKINNVVIWLVPALSNVFFWISYAMLYRHMALSMAQLLCWVTGLLYLVLGNYLPKCRENSVVGFRVKWTYSSEENWNATHRLGGYLFVVGGFVLLICGFLPENAATWACVLILIISTNVPLVYSWRFYRKQKAQGVALKERPKLEKKVATVVWGVVGGILVLSAVMLFTGNVTTQFGEEKLHVSVTYYGSRDIPYSDIDSVELRTENVGGTRVWGLGSFRLLAGSFENEELGSYTRFTYYDPHSAVVLKTAKGETVVLSGKDPEESRAIYEALLAHLPQSK